MKLILLILLAEMQMAAIASFQKLGRNSEEIAVEITQLLVD